jgi:hypothetical protein
MRQVKGAMTRKDCHRCKARRAGPPNVSPARKGWEIHPEEDPSAVGAALNRSSTLPVSLGAAADSDFLHRGTTQGNVCGFPPHEVRQRH